MRYLPEVPTQASSSGLSDARPVCPYRLCGNSCHLAKPQPQTDMAPTLLFVLGVKASLGVSPNPCILSAGSQALLSHS